MIPELVFTISGIPTRTHEGRLLRILALIDDYRRECLALRVARRLNSRDVIETVSDVVLWLGIPEHIRSDNGPEFVAQPLRDWLTSLGRGRCISNPAAPGRTGSVKVLGAYIQ